MGWLIALAVLVLVACLPLGISGHYDSGGVLICLIIGPMRLTVFPRKHDKDKNQNREQDEKNESGSGKSSRKKGGSLTEFKPLVKLILDLVVDLHRKIRVNLLSFKLILAGGDPCDLAVNYGRAWAAIGTLLPQLEEFFVIKKKDVEVECDFTSEQTLVLAHMDITITVGRLLSLGLRHGVRILRAYMKIVNRRKGGAEV